MDNNTKHKLLHEIEHALGAVDFGSVEIIVQDKKVTQISVRSIKKTSIEISQSAEGELANEQKEQTPADTQKRYFKIHAHFRRSE